MGPTDDWVMPTRLWMRKVPESTEFNLEAQYKINNSSSLTWSLVSLLPNNV